MWLRKSCQKWASDNRDILVDQTSYVEIPREREHCWAPKLGSVLERSILGKVAGADSKLVDHMSGTHNRVYYRTTGGLYWKVFADFSPDFRVEGRCGHSSRETHFGLTSGASVPAVIAALSSDVFWWWYTITSNLRDLNPYDIQNFPIPKAAVLDAEMRRLGKAYLRDITKNSTMLVRHQTTTGRTETQSFKVQKSKPIIDDIDRLLARHYGFTDEELDFIIHYAIKYRRGRNLACEGE